MVRHSSSDRNSCNEDRSACPRTPVLPHPKGLWSLLSGEYSFCWKHEGDALVQGAAFWLVPHQ